MRTHLTTLARLLPLMCVLALGAASPSTAQERHVIRIDDGVVVVNGVRVPAEQLPASLDTENLHLNFEFTGGVRFHVNGIQYGLENGRIVEIPVDEDGLLVFFRDEEGRGLEMARPTGRVQRMRLDAPLDQTFGSYVAVLDERAKEFEKLSNELAEPESTIPYEIAQRLHREAAQAATIVRAFPRVEVQTYFQALQSRDRSLYDQLVREQHMELASGTLARRIHMTSDPDRRQSLTESLRTQLEEIFELKQQNRRDEIEQLEQQLHELREQLAVRERNRAAIIGRRLEALVGSEDR